MPVVKPLFELAALDAVNWLRELATESVDLVVTDMAVIEVVPEGLLRREIAPDTTVEAVRKATGTELIVKGDVPRME